MIKQLQLKNFKCFKDHLSIGFKKLNLMTGVNGRGKSTLLQAIILLAQSAKSPNYFRNLVLKGENLTLGTYDDIRNNRTVKSEPIVIAVDTDDDFFHSMSFLYTENEIDQLTARLMKINFVTKDGPDVIENNDREFGLTDYHIELSGILERVHFVSADRIGPVNFVEKSSLPTFVNVGARGQHAINILANNDSMPVIHDNLYRGVGSKSLLSQTTEWLSYILDGAKLELKGREMESSILYMLLNNQEHFEDSSRMFKPTNVGFGYSYILPLIVTGLIAKPGEIVIIENPEAHLHPKAQSRIAEFFARLATIGVQVFIESHSEHILNALRVSTLNPDINITNDDLSILYFHEDFSMTRLEVDSNGRIDNWPAGFFDQQEHDLAQIFQLSRKQR